MRKNRPRLGKSLSIVSAHWADKMLRELERAKVGASILVSVPQWDDSFILDVGRYKSGDFKIRAEIESKLVLPAWSIERRSTRFDAARKHLKRNLEHVILAARDKIRQRAMALEVYRRAWALDKQVDRIEWARRLNEQIALEAAFSGAERDYREMSDRDAAHWLGFLDRLALGQVPLPPSRQLTSGHLPQWRIPLNQRPLPDDGYADGGEPYTDEELALEEQQFECQRCEGIFTMEEQFEGQEFDEARDETDPAYDFTPFSNANMVAQSAGGGVVCDDCAADAYEWTGPNEEYLVPKQRAVTGQKA